MIIEKETISHKHIFQVIGMSFYGKGPDWKLIGTNCGTMHKNKDYTVYIEKDKIGRTQTTCIEMSPSVQIKRGRE